MAKVFSRHEIFYLQEESSYGVIPNSSGTATLAGADACRMIGITMERMTATIARRDKTGSRTATAGIAGRKSARWSSNLSAVTSGVAGTTPDYDVMLKALVGQAASVKSGTVSISGATNASPIVISATGHGLSDYDCVRIHSVGGNTNANGFWCIRTIDANSFSLVGSSGNAAYTSGGTIAKAGLKYALHDENLPSFVLWSARKPYATAMQRALFGAVVSEGMFNFGEDIATCQLSGPARWYADSINFSNHTVQEKGSLTAMPDMSLLTPVTAGNGIAGFVGRIAIGSNEMVRIRTAQVKLATGIELPTDTFNNGYVDTPEADERNASASFSMYEDDTTAQGALEQAAVDKSSVDGVFMVGNVTGNVIIAVLKGMQLASPTRDDGSRAFVTNYGESRAYGSSAGVDEFTLWYL